MGRSVEDRTGQVIGFLTVLGRAPNDSGSAKGACWFVRCQRVLENGAACGNNRTVSESAIRLNLRRGSVSTCGCGERGKGNLRHGAAKKGERTREYSSWQSMMKRCENVNDQKYPIYGGRGIRVCEKLRTFELFAADLGPRPDGCSIDRWPDTNSHYSCGHCDECITNSWNRNVRWATDAEQQRNKTNNLVLRRTDGKEMCATDWEKELGLTRGRISARLNKGWSVEKALTPRDKT
jgi:hypothetical protein